MLQFQYTYLIYASGSAFLSLLGKWLFLTTGDPRETTFLFQRISICLQRHIALAVRGTFADEIVDVVDNC